MRISFGRMTFLLHDKLIASQMHELMLLYERDKEFFIESIVESTLPEWHSLTQFESSVCAVLMGMQVFYYPHTPPCKMPSINPLFFQNFRTLSTHHPLFSVTLNVECHTWPDRPSTPFGNTFEMAIYLAAFFSYKIFYLESQCPVSTFRFWRSGTIVLVTGVSYVKLTETATWH